MTLSDYQKEVLKGVQDHIHQAYSMLVTGFNIEMTEKLSEQAETDVEMVLMNTDRMMKQLLAMNDIISIQDDKKLDSLYGMNIPMDTIVQVENQLEQEYERAKCFKVS